MAYRLRRGPNHWQRGAAALLVALQATIGSAATLVHAADNPHAASALESRHTGQCLMLHDTERCVQCQVAATRVTTPPARRGPFSAALTHRFLVLVQPVSAPGRPASRAARPRAPPAPLS